MAVPILKIRGVSKSFGSKQVLDNVDLEVNEGEIFGVIGPSGAGKTTLLEAMVGFVPLNSGDISYRAENSAVVNFISIKKDFESIKNQIGFSTQTPSFYDKLTVKENLEYFAKLYNIRDEFIQQRISKILDLIELTGEEKTLAGELSGGMQKRLDIACSLINDPKILILDEPTADLDPLLRKHIWKLIKKINSMGKTVIVSSHFLEEIDELCTRIGLIHNKSIILSGTPTEMRNKYPYTQEIVLQLASRNYQKIALQLKGLPINKAIIRGDKMVIYTAKSDILLKGLMNVINKEREEVIELTVQKPTLDEVFTAIVNKKGA